MQQTAKRKLRRLGIAVAVLALLAAGWQAYRMSIFHVVKTDPKTSKVATESPYFRIYFNDVIRDDNSLQVDDQDNIITKTSIKDKTITFDFKEIYPDVTYTITLKKVTNVHGETITNKKFVFSPQLLLSKDMSEEQQQTLIGEQDRFVYSPENLNYVGFDDLTDQGMRSTQLDNVKALLFGYTQKINKESRTMTIPAGTAKISRPDFNTTALVADFTVILADKNYRAHAEYSLSSDGIRLQLFDAQGAQVYDAVRGITN